jgi:ABC-2 type transport system ATP-binding protein
MSAIIRTVNLCKDYGGGRGVRNLTMEVPARSIFGYIGPNGSGKTTTIRILCGLLHPDSGEAFIDGIEIKAKNHVQIKRTVGYLPDEFGVYQQMSVWEYLDFFGAAFKIPPKERRKRIEEVLELTDAKHMLDYQVSSLSRGMHQKIGIAKTMLHNPKVLILDEPANGLDPHARIEIRKTILRLKEHGHTIMLSSHILPELGSICDQVGIIEKGRLLTQGTVQEISRSLKENIHLEIMVDSDVEAAAKTCRGFENVQNVSFSGNEIRAEFLGMRNKLAELNKYLVEQGVRVVSLKETEVDLENVFLAVTGKDRQPDATVTKR